jgi:DNA (cytosine-5)-methyltransferase 1
VRDAWADVPPGEQQYFTQYKLYQYWQQRKPGKFGYDTILNLKRLSFDKPSATVCQTWGPGTATITHPEEPCYPTIAELKRICAFPDDFQLSGTFAQQWERLGRAVPPVMMSHIAATIRDEVLCKIL